MSLEKMDVLPESQGPKSRTTLPRALFLVQRKRRTRVITPIKTPTRKAKELGSFQSSAM